MLSIQQGSSDPTYPLTDEHGSILGEATEAGELTGATDYGPFGEQITQTQEPDPADPLADQSFGYLGAHARAGLYASEQIHMGARIYDPQSGRFISRDPLPGTSVNPQTQNPYAYGLGSPGRFYDLDGRAPGDSVPVPLPWPGPVVPCDDDCGFAIDELIEKAKNWLFSNEESTTDESDEAVADEKIDKDPKTPDEGGQFGRGRGGTKYDPDDIPAIDRSGRLHGRIPDRIPGHWTDNDLRQLAREIPRSIRQRKYNARKYGEDPGHRRRIQDEERLLRQIDKRLSGS